MTTITNTGQNKLKLNRLTKTQFNNASELESNELYLVDPEFIGSKALVTDANGDIAESSVTSTELGYLSGATSAIQSQLNGKVSDVTVNNTSIVSSGVANLEPAALNGSYGVVKLGAGTGGLAINSSGNLYVVGASQGQTAAKLGNINNPVMPGQIDTAVKAGMTTNTITLTDAEKIAACGWIGAVKDVQVNGTSVVTNNVAEIPTAVLRVWTA